VSSPTRLDKVLELENEIADAFSWIFALAVKLRVIFSLSDRTFKKLYPDSRRKILFENFADFDTIIWNTYGNEKFGVLGCRDDKKTVCECPIFLVYDDDKLKDLLPTLGKSR